MKIQPILSGILALAILGACKSSTTIVENDVGILRGSVQLFDINGDSVTNHSGATISLEGTSFQTNSQANGDFQLNNVPAGIYNVIVTKPSYDTDLTSSYQFSGTGTQFLQSNLIQAIPFDSLPILSINISKKDSIIGDSLQGHPFYNYSITVTFGISGPDSTTLHYFEWAYEDANGDTSAYNAIINASQFDSTVSQPLPVSRSFSTYDNNNQGGFYAWKPGDTVYFETRAVCRSPFSSFYPGPASPIIVRKKVVLP